MGEIKRKLLVVVFVFTAISSGVWFFLTKKSPLFPGETIHTGSTLARVAAAEDALRGQSDQAALSSFNFEPITSPLFQLPPGSVTSVEILDHTIEAEDIDGNSITSRTIRDGTILGKDIYRHAALDIASLTLAEGISVGGDASVTGDLTVSGDITARGALDLEGNLGIRSLAYIWPLAHSDGVLSNDGTGNLTWQTLGAASITSDALDFSEFKDALTLDASTDISVTGAHVFSLTNTGTGNSFLVNDVASDTTPFVIDASGNVGIGTITPSQKLEVNGDVKIGNAVLSGTGTDNFEINALINSIEIGTSRNTIGGGGSTVAPNIIGTTSLPFYNDFTPTDWAADTSYVAQSANVALIAGGYDNIVNQEAGVIVGGGHNFMKYNSNGHSIIGGGSYNLISAGRSGIVSGRRNTITGASEVFSFIGGGDDNNIIGSYSAILGGRDIDITGDYSSAFGRRAKVTADGSVAFSDSTDSDFTVSTANQFGARYSGGYTLTGGRFQITDDLASDGTLAQFYDLTSDVALDIRSNTGGSGLAAKHIDLVGISSVSDLAFSPSSDTRRALVIKDGGNVGIGTASPSKKLQVNGGVQIGDATVNSIDFRLTRTTSGLNADANYFVATANTPVHNWIEGGYLTGERAGTITAPNSGYPYYEEWSGNGASTIKTLGFINKTSGSFTISDMLPVLTMARTGNVGIGTTSPGADLNVIGNIAWEKSSGGYVATNHWQGNNPSVGYYAESGLLFGTVTTMVGGGWSEKMRITNTGNVGIGTTAPSQRLVVSGSAIIGDSALDNPQSWGRMLQVSNSGSNGAGISVKDSNNEFNLATYSGAFYISDGVDERITITAAGNVGIGTTAPGAALDIAADGGIKLSGSSNTNYLRSSVNLELVADLEGDNSSGYQNIVFKTAGTAAGNERMRINGTGNVGIMDTTPDGALDFDLTITSTTAATQYGGNFTVSDTGVVTTGTDTTYGTATTVTRTGATGGTIDTYGAYISLTNTFASGSGTANGYGSYISATGSTTGTNTLYGQYVTVSGADTNYSGIFMGGNFGVGDATPSALLTVGSGDLFQVSSAGNVSTVGQINGTDGLVTKVNSGTCDDSVFTLDTDGNLCVDSTNGRLYYRYSGAWHYSAQTAGFQIPNYEVYAYDFADRAFDTTRPLAENDFLIPFVENFMEDGAAHGLYAKFSDVKDALFYTEQQQISTLSLQTSQHITTLAELRVAVDDQLTVIGDSLAQYEETIEQQGDRLDVLDNDIVTLRDVVDIQDELLGRLVHDIESTVSQTALFTSQIATLTEQVAALTDFYITFDLGSLGSLVIRDDDGNVDLLDGKLKARILETGLLTIEADDPEGATIGRDKIESGEKVVTVKTTAVKTGSHIIITPRTLTAEPLAVTAVTDGEDFTVERITPATEDISFDWWIVEGE